MFTSNEHLILCSTVVYNFKPVKMIWTHIDCTWINVVQFDLCVCDILISFCRFYSVCCYVCVEYFANQSFSFKAFSIPNLLAYKFIFLVFLFTHLLLCFVCLLFFLLVQFDDWRWARKFSPNQSSYRYKIRWIFFESFAIVRGNFTENRRQWYYDIGSLVIVMQ